MRDDGKRTYVLNASSVRGVTVDKTGDGCRHAELRDVFGRKTGYTPLPQGILRLDVPESSYAVITADN